MLSGNWQLSSQVSRQWQLANTSWIHQQSSSVESGEQTQISSGGTTWQRQPGFSLGSRQQEEPAGAPEVLSCASLRKVKIRPTASCTSKLSSVSVTEEFYWYPPNSTCPPRALLQHVSYLNTSIHPISLSLSSKKLEHTTGSFLVNFSLLCPDKYSSTTQCKVNQCIHVTSKDSFILCSFTCLL